ncbi:MAG: VOC family protein [Pseudomonadota bacterium]
MATAACPIDHIMIGAPEFELALKFARDTFGIEAVPGGRHAQLSTRNALIGLNDGPLGERRYLELITPDEASNGSSPYRTALEQLNAPQLITAILACSDIDELAEKGRAAGMKTTGPMHLSRTGSDGKKLEWRLLNFSEHNFGSAMPTFIDWAEAAHPAADLEPAMSLTELFIETPHSEALHKCFTSLGVGIPTRFAETGKMKAVLLTPNGQVIIDGDIL